MDLIREEKIKKMERIKRKRKNKFKLDFF